jgi:hypothetical protein
LRQDFPLEVTPGQEENLEVQCVNDEFLAPKGGEIVDLSTRQVQTFSLAEVPNTNQVNSGGKIKAPALAGVYQLVFHFPFKKNPNTYGIIPGPIFTVK